RIPLCVFLFNSFVYPHLGVAARVSKCHAAVNRRTARFLTYSCTNHSSSALKGGGFGPEQATSFQSKFAARRDLNTAGTRETASSQASAQLDPRSLRDCVSIQRCAPTRPAFAA